MSKVLIIKRGAAGDVVRTTVLFHLLAGDRITWLVAPENRDLLAGKDIEIAESANDIASGRVFDLVFSLDDDIEVLRDLLPRIHAKRLIGAFVNAVGKIDYGQEMQAWFDMSIISRYGIASADARKLENRISYQQHLFGALGHAFQDHTYYLPPRLPESDLFGDIAFAPVAGARWPMKNWVYFDECISHFKRLYDVNVLPTRGTLLEHIADIAEHRVVVSNDSLPMHIAMGLKRPCVAFFTCTSPWEIHDYGLLEKVISPTLPDHFYRRDYVRAGAAAIPLAEEIEAIERALKASKNRRGAISQ